MKQTIEIEVPKGKKAIWKDNKVIFKDIFPNLPKTWEEFCNNNKIKTTEKVIREDSTICYWFGEEYRQYTCKNILPSWKAAEQHLALMQLHQLRNCYRQGWIPDWKEDSYKFCIINNNGCKLITSCKVVKFLSFPTDELAQYFLDNFRDLIEQAGDLI